MSRTYSAGIATAYGAAVRGGYTGTYDEFCAALGDLARVLTEFENFRATAQTLAEGQDATASYTNGILTLGIPKGNTGNGIRSISLLSTVGLIKTYRITYTNDNVFDFPVADGKGIKSTVLNSDYTLTITYTDDTTWTSTSIRGEVGATPQFSIGTVETLLPTQPASATITGTAERPILNLAIPRGQPGQDGASDAGAVTYTEGAEYSDGTVGEELNNLNRQLSDVEGTFDDYTKESYNIYSDTDDTEHWYMQESGKLVANNHHTTIIIEKNVNSGERIVVNTFGKLPTTGAFRIGISTTKPQADDTVTRLTSGVSQTGKYAITSAVSGNYIIITYGASTLSADELSAWDEIVKENLLVSVTTNQSATLDDFPYLPNRIIDVQEVNLSEDLKNKINSTPSATGVRLITSVRIPVESNVALATNTTAGAGWSGDFSNGYTHTSGNTDTITIAVDALENDEYVVEFDYNGNYDAFGFTVSLGDSYASDVYNGTNHVIVGLKAVNAGDVVLTPFSTYTGTVSNIKCRKVVVTSQEYIDINVNNISYTESATELTAFWNVRLGLEALNENINGNRNIAIGSSSLKKLLSGTRNIGVGTFTFPQLKGGEENIGIGADAGLYTQEATSSIAIGKAALSETKKTTHDIAIGRNALYGSRTGTTADNIAIGRNSGYKCASSNNIYIGAQAGYHNASGYNNIVIGPNADVQNNGNGSIAIGTNAKATKSKQCMIGSTAITEVVFCGDKKINFNSDGTVTWEALT